MEFFKNKVFRRVFLIYTAVIIASISFLSAFILVNVKKTLTANQTYINRKMIDSVNEYFKQQYDNSRSIINGLYSKQLELMDTINFLNYDYETYIKNRLDSYYKFEGYIYGGTNSFIRSAYNSNDNIESIIFYSYKNDNFSMFDSLGNIKYVNNIRKNISFDANEENINNSFIDLLNSYDGKERGSNYYIINKIKDPSKLDTVGLIIIKYKLDRLNAIMQSYDKSKNNIIAINKNGAVIYDSSNKYTGKPYPYIDRLKTTDKPIMLDKSSYIDFVTSTLDVIVVGIMPVENIYNGNKIITHTTIILAVILIIIAEAIVFVKIDSLSKRVNGITEAMKSVQEGNFKIEIKTGSEDDEFSMISKSFNDMCRQLNEYISRVYLSEIKQKNAEMLALQSQINPHFLYNTLESIRMKAVSIGEKDLGKMLYNLSALYRNMIKGKTFITIEQELEHCKMYLDLFKFRYEGKFNYCIDVSEELYSKEIIKFSLQPIIENFIVHGINLDRDDNYIVIYSEKDGQDAVIFIEDNGMGIEAEKVKSLNEKMENIETGDSIGLLNVNERIRLTYGEEYGLSVKGRKFMGTVVSIRIPIREVNSDV
ncbi:HAMP domain protein [Clostridiales bacterium oral taxon 876 str. F0540]|nr:HAMP domain protein [Clostridiales bacterium oral taxon 876 str. F0540]